MKLRKKLKIIQLQMGAEKRDRYSNNQRNRRMPKQRLPGSMVLDGMKSGRVNSL